LVDKALLCCWSEASLEVDEYTMYEEKDDN